MVAFNQSTCLMIDFLIVMTRPLDDVVDTEIPSFLSSSCGSGVDSPGAGDLNVGIAEIPVERLVRFRRLGRDQVRDL